MRAAEEFQALLSSSTIEPAAVAKVASFLDGLGHEDRVTAVRAAGRNEQRKLYEGAKGFAPVKLVDLVAPDTPDLTGVRHYGKNTLPLFTHFEKRFCRAAGTDPQRPGELFGFNFQTLAPVTGPGYFVAVEDEPRGEVLVDYRRLPSSHPPDWPAIVSNERGLSRLVYGFMVDTLRRVSEHVTIGSAAKRGKDLGSWFILCREA